MTFLSLQSLIAPLSSTPNSNPGRVALAELESKSLTIDSYRN